MYTTPCSYRLSSPGDNSENAHETNLVKNNYLCKNTTSLNKKKTVTYSIKKKENSVKNSDLPLKKRVISLIYDE